MSILNIDVYTELDIGLYSKQKKCYYHCREADLHTLAKSRVESRSKLRFISAELKKCAFAFETATQYKDLIPVSHCKQHGKQTNK